MLAGGLRFVWVLRRPQREGGEFRGEHIRRRGSYVRVSNMAGRKAPANY